MQIMRASNPAFWSMARQLLRYPRKLALAGLGAVLTAASFGAGLGMIYPALRVLLERAPVLSRILQQVQQRPQLPDGIKDWIVWAQGRIPPDPFEQFIILLVLIGTLVALSGVGRFLHERFAADVALAGCRDLRDRAFRRLLEAPYAAHLQRHSSQSLNHLLNDIRVLGTGFHSVLGRPLTYLLKGMAALAIALSVKILLVAALTTGGLFLLLLLRRLNRHLRASSARALKGSSALLQTAQETLSALPLIKSYRTEPAWIKRFQSQGRDLYSIESSMQRAKAIASPLGEVLILLFVGLMAAISAWMIFRSELNAAGFITVLLALTVTGQSLKPLANLTHSLSEAEAAARNLEAVFAIPAESEDRPAQPELPRHREQIVFEDVSFRYPAATRPALEGVHLKIRHGEAVLLAGRNGSGKTTLVHLLPRLLTPHKGRILIDGFDISQVSLKSLRQQIALVPQSNLLLAGTISENIRMGRNELSDEDVQRAAREAFADEFIRECPQGYQTLLGERGQGLSAGQSQRLALARALAGDPSILILDEATANVDPRSRKRLAATIRRQRGRRTVLLLSHSQEMVKAADRVVLMEGFAPRSQERKEREPEKAAKARILRRGKGARAEVRLVEREGALCVLKDYRHSGIWFRRTAGAYMARREAAAYRRLRGLEGVPQLLGRLRPDGLLLSYIPHCRPVGEHLLPAAFFEQADELLQQLRQRSVLHGDVRRNLHVGQDGRPVLLDFGASFVIPWWLRFLRPVLVRAAKKHDERALIEVQFLHGAEPLTAREEAIRAKPLPFQWIVIPVQTLLRRTLERLFVSRQDAKPAKN